MHRATNSNRSFHRAAPVVSLLLAAVLIALAGCAGSRTGGAAGLPGEDARRLDAPADETRSLVFGYLDMSDAPTELGWLDMRQVAPRTSEPYYHMRVHEGVFYMEKFPPGVFVLGEFGGRRWTGKHLAYRLPRSSPTVRLAIDEPGLHFVGAYKYRPVIEDGVRVGRFEIDRGDAPSESEVLARILPFAQGTAWEARIRARLAGG